MGNIWKKVERGIRYRKHLTRKYGVPRRFDRYYVIRIAVGGVMRQEALGWESEGITLEKAAWSLPSYEKPSVAALARVLCPRSENSLKASTSANKRKQIKMRGC